MQENSKQKLEAWEKVDQTLRVIAKRRAQLDVAEARLLREALALEIWKPLGMVSAIDYMERVLGYSPHTACERLRVSEALGELPELAEALASNELHFSAVRELTRIVIPETQREWIEAAKGRNQREVEMLVGGRDRGSRPSDPANPDLRPRTVQLKLAPDVYARFRQVRLALEKEHGRRLDDNELISALANAYLDGPAGSAPTERARHQIALTVCEVCKQGWQEGGGQQIAVDARTVERAECDAQHIGSIDAEVPARARQDISPAVRRLVSARDGGRCQIPGCRSTRNLDLHHLVHRADGGGHEPSNIVTACGSCHRALHEGRLIVSGTAERIVVRRPGVPIEIDVDGSIARALDAELDIVSDSSHTGHRADAERAVDAASHVGHNFDPPRSSDGIASQPCASHVGHRSGAERASPEVDAASHVGRNSDAPRRAKLDRAILRSQARDALVGAGWTRSIACDAVDAALRENPEALLEQIIRVALRFCLQSRARSPTAT